MSNNDDADGRTLPPPPMDQSAFRGGLMARARSAPARPLYQPPARQAQPQQRYGQVDHAAINEVLQDPNAPPPLAEVADGSITGVAPVSTKQSIQAIGRIAQRKVVVEKLIKDGEEIPRHLRPKAQPQQQQQAPQQQHVRRPQAPTQLPTGGRMSLAQLAESRGIALNPSTGAPAPRRQQVDEDEGGQPMTGADAMAAIDGNDGFGYTPGQVIRRLRPAAPARTNESEERDQGNSAKMASAALRGIAPRRAT